MSPSTDAVGTPNNAGPPALMGEYSTRGACAFLGSKGRLANHLCRQHMCRSPSGTTGWPAAMSPNTCMTVKAVTTAPCCSLRTAHCRAVHLGSDRTARSLTKSSTTPRYSACWHGWRVLLLQVIVKPNQFRCSTKLAVLKMAHYLDLAVTMRLSR